MQERLQLGMNRMRRQQWKLGLKRLMLGFQLALLVLNRVQLGP